MAVYVSFYREEGKFFFFLINCPEYEGLSTYASSEK
jgi:hypothetical protein